MGLPPALPGRQSTLDISGGIPRLKELAEAARGKPLGIVAARTPVALHVMGIVEVNSATG